MKAPGEKEKEKEKEARKQTDKTQPKIVTIINIKIKMLKVLPFSISSLLRSYTDKNCGVLKEKKTH